jgi:AcrR family transcriptional regulator
LLTDQETDMFTILVSSPPSKGRSSQQLPSGRHGLPRGYVVHNQRERILHAVVIVAARHGYGAMTIEEVVAVAGVSRRTFYDHFGNKEEAFLAAYDLVVEQLVDVVDSAYGSGTAWPERIRLAVAAFLGHLAASPDIAHMCLVEILAAGPRALDRRTAAMRRFHPFFLPGPAELPGEPVDGPLAAEAAIGGLYEVVYGRILAQDTARLPELLPSLLRNLLLPFVGAGPAEAESRAAEHQVARAARAGS